MIKVQIDEIGNLCLNRARTLKKQWCCRQCDCTCGDWCPLFEEPVTDGNQVYMRLCHRFITCDAAEFEDLRNNNKE